MTPASSASQARRRRGDGPSTQGPSTQGPGTQGPSTQGPGTQGRGVLVRAGSRHDPRVDPPTRADKRRFWGWVAFLCFSPICLGVMIWAALDLNGGYPTVKPPVPSGWKAVPGIYASISVPDRWQLQQDLSDSAGDIYYSGPGGGIGLSVTEQKTEPAHFGHFPAIVRTFLGGSYRLSSVAPVRLRNATEAWSYRFALPGGGRGTAVLAWVKPTETQVWLVASRLNSLTGKVIGTLTLAR